MAFHKKLTVAHQSMTFPEVYGKQRFFNEFNKVRPEPTDRQVISDNNFRFYILKIHFNIILPSTPRLHKWSLLFIFT